MLVGIVVLSITELTSAPSFMMPVLFQGTRKLILTADKTGIIATLLQQAGRVVVVLTPRIKTLPIINTIINTKSEMKMGSIW